MTHSKDLRERVISFVEQGGSKVEAAKLFKVNRTCIYNWLRQPIASKTGPKGAHTLDMAALAEHVRTQPDALLVERAEAFGVSHVGIWKALRRLGMSKKNVAVR